MSDTAEYCAETLAADCPKYYEMLVGIAESLEQEDLDLLTLSSGMEGGGKSNGLIVTNFALAHLLQKPISIKKDFFFSGEDYLNSLKKIMLEMIEKTGFTKKQFMEMDLNDNIDDIEIKPLDKIKDKYKNKFMILDEAQDLMHLDSMKRFNKTYTKIMMSVREMNMIFHIAYPDLRQLNNYLKNFRVKIFDYHFIAGDGSRIMANYTRKNYFKIAITAPKMVQFYTLLGEAFINKFRPSLIVEKIPIFPKDTKEWIRYLKLKRLNMAKTVFKNMDSDDEKMERLGKAKQSAAKSSY